MQKIVFSNYNENPELTLGCAGATLLVVLFGLYKCTSGEPDKKIKKKNE